MRLNTRLTLVQGPLVGDKKSSQAITEEYAKADPVFVAKTSVRSSKREFASDFAYMLVDITSDLLSLPSS